MSEFDYQLFNDDESSAFLETRDSYKRVHNLDKFLSKAYDYYLGKGFFNILLAKFLNLISLLWVICFATFLLTSVDYAYLFQEVDTGPVPLSSVIHFRGFQPFILICLVIFCVFWLWKFLQFCMESKDNWEIRHFYHQELQIPEEEIATIEWKEVVNRIIKVPRLCITKEQMTPLDIANRIMRKDNYLIAMINKDILHLYIPLPGVRSRAIVTKTLEWGLSYTIFSFVFDQNNSINKQVLDPSKSRELAEGLKSRFRLMGLFSLLISPFMFVFLLVYFVFQYGEQLHNNPTTFAARQWSPLARWKFRELNELPHVFQSRLRLSYSLADKYVSSFPMNTVGIIARFISFIIGSLVAVLLILSVRDEDALFNLEIFSDRSAIWFVGVGGTIIAGCRALIPDENTVMDPTKVMEDLAQFTHYMPSSWKGKAHTTRVLGEFNQLFEYKIVSFVIELFSVLFAPFILLFSLPNSAEKVIEFFRVFTVNEPGVGDVCKFATFPLEENGNKKYGVDSNANVPKSMKTKQGKLEKSFLNFKANYPEWQPQNAAALRYLSNLSQNAEASTSDSVDDNNRDRPRSPSSAPTSYLYSRNDIENSVFLPERRSLQDNLTSMSRIQKPFYRSGGDSSKDL
eukprot:TRINITY_DN4793_c0_g1_i1.p1 TRINITY_DN4793_c0_g1~~TRINITY_DN4793_c0_g1_i1.p1  ORF type:complete len:627 (-),score=150.46 TRINITY_DN4793_c0_g1_i1:465-2345(-)